MNTTRCLLTLLLVTCAAQGLSAAQPPKGQKTMDNQPSPAKIAIVDINRIMSQDPELLKEEGAVSHEWRDLLKAHTDVMKKVEEDFKRLEAQYQSKMKELEALQKSGLSTPESLQKKYNEEAAPLGQQLQMQSQQIQQFQASEWRKIESSMSAKIIKATDEVVAEHGWDFAINKNALLSSVSSGSRFNITESVLKKLNASYKPSDKPAPAA